MKRFLRIVGIVIAVLAVALVSAWLALRRADIPYVQLEKKYANAHSRFMDMPGGLHVHYRDEGNPAGAPIILVHGFAASLQAWEPWAAQLGRDYRVISLDLPGHGLTRAPAGYQASIDGYADLVDQLARKLGVSRYVIVGNSMGGAVAWDEDLRHGADVRALVLVNSAGWPGGERSGDAPIVFKVMASPIGRAVIRDVDISGLAREGLKKAYVDPALVTPALVDRYVELARAPGHRDILMTIQDRPGSPVTAATFRAIGAPTLVMFGADDKLIPAADGKAFASAIPGARLIIYPGVGHVPMEQIPARSEADLAAFLKSLDSAPAAKS